MEDGSRDDGTLGGDSFVPAFSSSKRMRTQSDSSADTVDFLSSGPPSPVNDPPINATITNELLVNGNSTTSPPGNNADADKTLMAAGLDDSDTLSEDDWAAPLPREVQELMQKGVSPKCLLQQLCPGAEVPDYLTDAMLWRLLGSFLEESAPRPKLSQYNTLEDAVELIRSSSRILVLTGAGISVSCGIPDFRSKNGIYARLHEEFPDLPNPEAMFDITFFRQNPKPFFEFASQIYPGSFQPSLCHSFIGQLEKCGKLLRNYSQNIDCLEHPAGVTKLVQCHGSFASATCCNCGHKADCEALREDIMAKRVPRCPVCPLDAVFAVMKPDIIFFGESLPETFHRQIREDKDQVDLLIVIGSSLKVRPVSLIPRSIPPSVPQILINREPNESFTFDVNLLGSSDDICAELCRRLGDGFLDVVMSQTETRDEETSQSAISKNNRPMVLQQITETELLQTPPTSTPKVVEEVTPADAKQIATDMEGTSNDVNIESDSQEANVQQSARESATSDEKAEEERLEAIRQCYAPRFVNLASLLPPGHFLFIPPNISVFEGAEVFRDLDDDENEPHDGTIRMFSSTFSGTGSESTDSGSDESETEAELDSESNKENLELGTSPTTAHEYQDDNARI